MTSRGQRHHRIAARLAERARARSIRERMRILALGPPTTEALVEERHGLVSALFAGGLTPEQAARKEEIEAELDRRDGPLIEDMDRRHARQMRRLGALHSRIDALLVSIEAEARR